MERIIYILLALYGTVMLLMCFLQYYTVFKNKEKPKNNVHFYVARDKNGELFLYMGKPFRGIDRFHEYQNGCIITGDNNFYNFDLNKNDFDNLKWEDKPVEVFLNLNN